MEGGGGREQAAYGGPGTKAWLSSPIEVYTIQGNSHGKPCTIPFKYDNQWFHSCTSTGREDGHLWCATTQDYGKDERWGFCPIKSEKQTEWESPGGRNRERRWGGRGGQTDSERSEERKSLFGGVACMGGSWGGTYGPSVAVAGNDCETFWDKDQLTDSCYQFNFQSTLSWREAWASCEQQGADLLSITEIHEQTYINGEVEGSPPCGSASRLKSDRAWGWGTPAI